MKKQRGKYRKNKGVNFYANFEMLRYAMYWNMRIEASRQSFYKGNKRSRKVSQVVAKQAHKIILDDYKNRLNRAYR